MWIVLALWHSELEGVLGLRFLSGVQTLFKLAVPPLDHPAFVEILCKLWSSCVSVVECQCVLTRPVIWPKRVLGNTVLTHVVLSRFISDELYYERNLL